MGKKAKSARGELVDFDLLKIKNQIASAPPSADVRAREDFIDRRLRRRLKKVTPPAPKIHAKDPIEVKLPGTEELSEETKMIDEVPKKPKTSRTRQKTRPPTKKAEDSTYQETSDD